jgi:cation transport ATPase
MEVLIVLATVTAYVYSVIVVIVNMILKVPSPMVFFDVAPSKYLI